MPKNKENKDDRWLKVASETLHPGTFSLAEDLNFIPNGISKEAKEVYESHREFMRHLVVNSADCPPLHHALIKLIECRDAILRSLRFG